MDNTDGEYLRSVLFTASMAALPSRSDTAIGASTSEEPSLCIPRGLGPGPQELQCSPAPDGARM